MHARPNAVVSLRCQENQHNCYIARLIVRLEGKLSSLGRAHPIFYSALSPGGEPKKSGGNIKILGRCFAPAFCASPLSNCLRRHCEFSIILAVFLQGYSLKM